MPTPDTDAIVKAIKALQSSVDYIDNSDIVSALATVVDRLEQIIDNQRGISAQLAELIEASED